MAAHTNYTHALTQASGRRALFRMTLRQLQNPSGFQDARLLRTLHVPHTFYHRQMSHPFLIYMPTQQLFTPTSSLTLYQTWHKGQSLYLDQAL